MKRMITTILVLSVLAFAAYGQTSWGWVGGLGTERADTLNAYGHGVAVDAAGKIWYESYYNSETVLIDTGSGTKDYEDGVRAIYVFNPDGTEASFSPITEITVDGVTDTLQNSNRGLRADHNGDIVASSYWEAYRINHLTGAGMAHVLPADSSTLTAVAFTDDGEMVVSYVLPGHGIDVFDADFAFVDKVIPGESTNAYARTVEVAKDGTAIYYTAFTNGIGFVRFTADDIYSDFTANDPDTLALGLAVESVAWNPATGYLWAGNTGGAGWTNAAHYAFDPAGDFTTPVDSIIMPPYALKVAPNVKPRGIDFSADGNTAYVVFFNTWDSDPIYKFVKGAVGVWEHTGTFISGYSMQANYPNPFNPSTRIDVSMKEAGVADLRIYDIRGAEVAVLNNSYLPAGNHSFTFNGSNLAAGVYIAKFIVNGAMYTQNMTLIK